MNWEITNFTPLSALAGGLLIGIAAVLLMLGNGRIAGISGMFHGLLRWERQLWQGLFLLGLILAAGTVHAFRQELGLPATPVRDNFPLAALLVAGFLVGFGTRLGAGCTSGHGVCGIGRRAWRSIIATIMFMSTAILTTYVCYHLLEIF